jgi:hypothetical protein
VGYEGICAAIIAVENIYLNIIRVKLDAGKRNSKIISSKK